LNVSTSRVAARDELKGNEEAKFKDEHGEKMQVVHRAGAMFRGQIFP
jgi:hypothetical protein